MTIQEALKKYPEDETELFLSHLLTWDKPQLYTKPDTLLTPLQEQQLTELVNQFRHGAPAAYLLGYKYFYGLKFMVTQDTLIPRPETEWLIDKAKECTPNAAPHILDMGTGSGCIAITLATLLPEAKITAADISEKALNVAAENAHIHHASVTFLHSDLFAQVTGHFDIIIANLPYVPYSDYLIVQKNLQYEPENAITTFDETWEIYNTFLYHAKNHINKKGIILLEIDPKQRDVLPKIIAIAMPEATYTFDQDIHGLYRYCTIQLS